MGRSFLPGSRLGSFSPYTLVIGGSGPMPALAIGTAG